MFGNSLTNFVRKSRFFSFLLCRLREVLVAGFSFCSDFDCSDFLKTELSSEESKESSMSVAILSAFPAAEPAWDPAAEPFC